MTVAGLTHPWDFSTCVAGRWLCQSKCYLFDLDTVILRFFFFLIPATSKSFVFKIPPFSLFSEASNYVHLPFPTLWIQFNLLILFQYYRGCLPASFAPPRLRHPPLPGEGDQQHPLQPAGHFRVPPWPQVWSRPGKVRFNLLKYYSWWNLFDSRISFEPICKQGENNQEDYYDPDLNYAQNTCVPSELLHIHFPQIKREFTTFPFRKKPLSATAFPMPWLPAGRGGGATRTSNSVRRFLVMQMSLKLFRD